MSRYVNVLKSSLGHKIDVCIQTVVDSPVLMHATRNGARLSTLDSTGAKQNCAELRVFCF